MDFAFGNSHIIRYNSGHELARDQGLVRSDLSIVPVRELDYKPLVKFTDGGPVFNPDAIRDVRSAIETLQPACVITSVMGSGHWVQGAANHPQPYDFLVPDLPQHPQSPDTQLVPYDLVLKRLHGDLDWQFNLVRQVQSCCEVPIFNIEAPPPVANFELFMRGVYGHFRHQLEQHGCPSTSFRYKMWWISTWLTQRICDDLGIHFVAGPRRTRDQNEFLAEEYYDDGIHGSVEYAALMAVEIEKEKSRLGIAGA